MSKSDATRFLESVSEPPGLSEFQAALNDSVEAIVQLGRDKGFEFDAKQVGEAISEIMANMPPPESLSEQALDSVVGGTTLYSSSSLTQLGIALHSYHNYEGINDYTSYWTL